MFDLQSRSIQAMETQTPSDTPTGKEQRTGVSQPRRNWQQDLQDMIQSDDIQIKGPKVRRDCCEGTEADRAFVAGRAAAKVSRDRKKPPPNLNPNCVLAFWRGYKWQLRRTPKKETPCNSPSPSQSPS